MNDQRRMSPATAFFLGFFGLGAVGVAAGASVLLYTLTIVNQQVGGLVTFIGDLPEFVESLPPSVGELLHDRRAPDYASQINVKVDFIKDREFDAMRPVLTIENAGNETITLLALRIAVLDSAGVAFHDWTEVVATPIAVNEDWRGPMLPGSPRHVVLNSVWWDDSALSLDDLAYAVEIADVRVWEGNRMIKTASAGN